MGDIRAAVLALLTGMGGFGHVISSTDTPDVHGMALLGKLFLKGCKHGIRIQGCMRL